MTLGEWFVALWAVFWTEHALVRTPLWRRVTAYRWIFLWGWTVLLPVTILVLWLVVT